MYPYPKLRAGLQARWTADGNTLCLYDAKNGQGYRLSRPCGRLLCGLDGWTRPGRGTGLTGRTVYRWLRLFARHDLLEGEDRWFTAPGCLLWSHPCPRLRRASPNPVLRLYYQFVRWGWLPLLTALVLSFVRGGGRLPDLELGTGGVLVCLLAANLPGLILHELAHAGAANARGVPVSALGVGVRTGLPCAFCLMPLLPFAPRQVRRAVYRAGPLSNLCLGCLLLLLCLWVPLFRQEALFWAAVCQLTLALLNLLPLEGLDGSGILETFPPLARALAGRPGGSGWNRFLEGAGGLLLGLLARVGLPVFLFYEALSLISLLWEVFFS